MQMRSPRGWCLRAAAIVALALLAPVVASSASAAGGRVITKGYTVSADVFVPPFGVAGATCTGGCLSASHQPKERHVSIEMRDASGVPVYGMVDGPGGTRTFCGSITLALPNDSRVLVEAPLDIEPTLPCAQPTTGTIVATFTA